MEERRTYQFSLLFPNKNEDHVLIREMTGNGKGVHLPYVQWNDDDQPCMDDETLREKFESKLRGIIESNLMIAGKQYFLLYLEPLVGKYCTIFEDYIWLKVLLVFDNLSIPDVPPQGYRWASRKELEISPLQEFPEVEPEVEDGSEGELRRLRSLSACVSQFFAKRTRTVPWETKGWYTSASSWIFDSLKHVGLKEMNPPVRVCSTSQSMVMSVDTSFGIKVYFKAQKEEGRWPLRASEPLITKYLSTLFPGSFVPNVLAIDKHRGWMLTEEFGKKMNEDHEESCASYYHSIINSVVRFQKECVNRKEELYCASCRYEGLRFIQLNLMGAIHGVELSDLLGASFVSEMKKKTDLIDGVFKFMENLKVPDTLSHGHLSWPNIAFPRKLGGSFTFFNWGPAVVSHPFFDAFRLMEDSRLGDGDQQTIKECYLKNWEDCAPPDKLERGWHLIRFIMIMRCVARAHYSSKSEKRASDLKLYVPNLLYWLNEDHQNLTDICYGTKRKRRRTSRA